MSKENYHTGIRIIGYDLIVQRLSKPKEVNSKLNKNILSCGPYALQLFVILMRISLNIILCLRYMI